MKARIIALLLVAGAVASPIHTAEAGALTDALRNRVGQAVFVGKVVKGNLANAVRNKLRHFIQ
jgi:hypothetical protein